MLSLMVANNLFIHEDNCWQATDARLIPQMTYCSCSRQQHHAFSSCCPSHVDGRMKCDVLVDDGDDLRLATERRSSSSLLKRALGHFRSLFHKPDDVPSLFSPLDCDLPSTSPCHSARDDVSKKQSLWLFFGRWSSGTEEAVRREAGFCDVSQDVDQTDIPEVESRHSPTPPWRPGYGIYQLTGKDTFLEHGQHYGCLASAGHLAGKDAHGRQQNTAGQWQRHAGLQCPAGEWHATAQCPAGQKWTGGQHQAGQQCPGSEYCPGEKQCPAGQQYIAGQVHNPEEQCLSFSETNHHCDMYTITKNTMARPFGPEALETVLEITKQVR